MKNTRKISALVAAALMMATLVSCGEDTDSAPLGFKEISNDGVSYDLYVPDEWTTDISTGVTAAYYSGIDPSNISMMAFELSGKEVTSIADYWAIYEPSLKAMFPDLEYVGEPDEVTLDEVPAMQYIYTGTVADVQYKLMQIVAIKNASVYIFTYTAETAKYDEHIEDVLAILDYFNFTE